MARKAVKLIALVMFRITLHVIGSPVEVAPTLMDEIDMHRTTIYTVAVPLAWKALEAYIRAPIRLSRKIRTHGYLSTFEADRSYDTYTVSLAGSTSSDIQPKIRAAALRLFGRPSEISMSEGRDRRELWSYGAMSFSPKFATPFESTITPEGRMGFGFASLTDNSDAEQMARQVWYTADTAGTDAVQQRGIVSIDLANTDATLVVAYGIGEAKTHSSLDELVKISELIISSGTRAHFGIGSSLHIPLISLRTFYVFDEFIGVHLLNPGYEEYFIQRMETEVEFSLDKVGARIGGEAIIVLKRGRPVQIEIEPPFLVYLRSNAGAAPCFVVWIVDENSFGL